RWRFHLYPQDAFLPPPPPPAGVGDLHPKIPHSNLHAPYIKPQVPTVTIRPGQTATDLVDFGVPPKPSSLDVFFLVDTTSSMDTSMEGLRHGLKKIATDIAVATDGYACFGVGDFK